MVDVTIYGIHGSYGYGIFFSVARSDRSTHKI